MYKTIMTKRILHIILLLILVSSDMFSQTQKQLIHAGDELFREGNYTGASNYYRKAMKFDSSDIQLIYSYAESFRKDRNYVKAEIYYQQVYKKDGGRELPKAVFWLATMQKYNGKNTESYKNWKMVKTLFRNGKLYENKKAKQEIKSSAYARRAKKYKNEAVVKNIGGGLNSYDSEFNPIIFKDKMYFSSLRSQNGEFTENYHVKIYEAQQKDSAWEMIDAIENNINTAPTHNANSCFSPDGKEFYFTRCEGFNHCNIFVSNYQNGKWGNAKLLNINKENETSTQPMICKINGEEVLFFVSDRRGGYGKLDIWYAKKESSGKFSEPVNVGKNINSIDNEITPFYDSKNRLLYFSSDWHSGLGGFDIFKAKGSLKRFSRPQNLGAPINTRWNDMYYFIDTSNSISYLASNREGSLTNKGATCCNDIYSVKFPEPKKVEEIAKEIITLEDLNKYLPVTLYFHNDCPNPRTRATTTNLNYLTTYQDYLVLKPTYNAEYSKGLSGLKQEEAVLDIQDFFKDYVQKGVTDLKLFTNLLIIELDKGVDVELTVKGFASPLAKTDYNVNLTGRRISSLINYFNEFEGGKFKKYLDGTSTNKGKLTFVRVPFGENKASSMVSDNINDQRNSIYSRSAALERKIEIVSVNVKRDSTNTAEYKVDKVFIDKGKIPNGTPINIEFTITNTGKIPLNINEIKASCGCTMVEMDKSPFGMNESRKMKATINTEQIFGKQTKIITIFSNANPRKKELTITFEVVSSR